MKIKRVMAAVMCTVVLACGCGNNEGSDVKKEEEVNQQEEAVTQTEPEEKEYQEKLDMIEPSAYRDVSGLKLEPGSYISVIGKADGGEYWEQVEAGASQAVADINKNLGYKGKDEVKVVYSGPGEAGDVDEQVNILDEELARYPVALSIAVVDSKACGVQFDLAAESGIPIVAFDSGNDYPGLMAMVATDNKKMASEVADHMAEFTGSSGEVIMFVSDSCSESAMERETGFMEQIGAAYPEMMITEVYHMDQQEDMRNLIAAEKGIEHPEEITEEEILDYILARHPELKGCYATDGETTNAVVDALARAGREDVKVIGYDADEEEQKALKDGKIDGLVVQNPFGMGYASAIASARAALSMGNEAYINTGAVWVTKENLESDRVKKLLEVN